MCTCVVLVCFAMKLYGHKTSHDGVIGQEAKSWQGSKWSSDIRFENWIALVNEDSQNIISRSPEFFKKISSAAFPVVVFVWNPLKALLWIVSQSLKHFFLSEVNAGCSRYHCRRLLIIMLEYEANTAILEWIEKNIVLDQDASTRCNAKSTVCSICAVIACMVDMDIDNGLAGIEINSNINMKIVVCERTRQHAHFVFSFIWKFLQVSVLPALSMLYRFFILHFLLLYVVVCLVFVLLFNKCHFFLFSPENNALVDAEEFLQTYILAHTLTRRLFKNIIWFASRIRCACHTKSSTQ